MLLLLPAVLPATACDGDGGGGGGKVGTDGGVVGGGQDIGGDGSPDGGPDGGLADAGPGGGGADGGGAADGGADGGGAADGGAPGFDDHTVATLPDLAALERLMVGAPGRRQAKFLVTRFAEGDQARIRYMDGSFYGMHDEWYWFTLLNGQPVAGETEVAPLPGRSFATVRQIVDWCRGLAELPLDLRFVLDGRLYSPRFYHLALDVEPRVFGLGGLLHLAAVEGVRPELWLFELEYSDAVTHETLVRFFELLDATLPPGIAGTLRWVVRSPAQEVVARQMEEQRLPYWDRLVRYGELAVPGETEVYSPGITAGRLKVLRAGEPGLGESRPTDVLLLEEIPDWLPPAAGLVTAVPQTPLAHINILARNRGIPNGYRGGILDDPSIDQLARGYAPVLVHAVEPDRLDLLPLTEEQYATYRRLTIPPPLVVPPVELQGAPYAMPLASLHPEQADGLRPLIGGKSTGTIFLAALLGDARGAVAPPHRPVAITIRPYVEHLAPLRERIGALLLDPAFQGSSLVRLLALEGPELFDERHPEAAAQQLRADILARPPGDVLGDLVRAGGLRQAILDSPITPATLAEIRRVLEEQLGGYAVTQGLRFRSSSNVEDVEGFNGAGLYESYTGFLRAEEQPSARDRRRTVELALKQTWASYWATEAFEERQLARVDHRSGAMGVLVHARFDDELELANGVLTFTRMPAGAELLAVMDVNVQLGSLSVTNPEPGSAALPEVDRLELRPGGPPAIVRLRPSTEVDEGEVVLADGELAALFARVQELAEAWVGQANAGLPAAQRRRVVVLDLELRKMRQGWPALDAGSGQPFPERLVLKQVRSLDPGLSRLPEEVLSKPFPRDILARARRADRRVCAAEPFVLVSYDAVTDPGRPPDMGYSTSPFTALVMVSFRIPLPALGIAAGHQVAVDHLGIARAAHPRTGPGVWDLQLELAPAAAAAARFDSLEITAEGGWRIAAGAASVSGAVQCSSTALFSSPADYLLDLLARERGGNG